MLPAVDLLISPWADVNAGNHNVGIEWTNLHTAANEGDLSLAECILQTGTALVNKQDKTGFAPFHVAARKRHRKLVECLIKNGADVGIATLAGNKAVDISPCL